MEQFFFPFIQCWHWSWSEISSLSYSFYVISLSNSLYFWKMIKKSKNSHLYSFVNDGLFVAQNKSLIVSNLYLFYSYHIISSLLEQFGLILEYGKIEVFHFSRSQRVFDPPSLNLILLGGPILLPKNIWQYLGLIFDNILNSIPTKPYQPLSA